ncbi:hypothetical protein Micbo1qcDRAFT_192184 [Microdochium bolleyi]|uniref:Mitochondrial export protein Som1 n=1 Tax=Microdochium bolleyi TaxID=196109 RepID=A0A136JD65_9PEZI|nr:hypothetical protein Micbo1qcDRAFT_192184 [Microdochium bolleyi]
MAPPVAIFPASELEDAIQLDQGRRRKVATATPTSGDSGSSGVSGSGSERGSSAAIQRRRIDLSACELLSMVQYDCQIERPEDRQETVKCWPVQRWFRRCADQKGSFMVETTAWEGKTEDA